MAGLRKGEPVTSPPPCKYDSNDTGKPLCLESDLSRYVSFILDPDWLQTISDHKSSRYSTCRCVKPCDLRPSAHSVPSCHVVCPEFNL